MKSKCFFIVPLVLFTLIACNKDYSFEHEPRSKGSLKTIDGICIDQQVKDSFIVGQTLRDSDLISIQVRVIEPGSYKVSSDTVNGYSFSTTGYFNETGFHTIQLKGNGKPIKTGLNSFIITYDSTSCPVQLKIFQDLNLILAGYTLLGAPNTCEASITGGYFYKDYFLSDSNTLSITVNVASPGKYAINTNIINGYSFSNSGIFYKTGIQKVLLKAKGKPLQEGVDIFEVTGVNSSCKSSIRVSTKPSVLDHFPLTLNSNWSYDDLLNPPDTISRRVTSLLTANVHSYTQILNTILYTSASSEICRKEDTSFYEYAPLDKYTQSFHYDPEIKGEILFLKEGLKTGETWQSDEYSGPITYGQIILLKYTFKCIDANATIVLNGNTFTNVYIIEMKPMLRATYSNFESTGEDYIFYYAKGIGRIYWSRHRDISGLYEKYEIKNWIVK